MAKSVILYFTELGSIHTQRALSDCGDDRGLHSDRKFFLNSLWFVLYRDMCLSVKRTQRCPLSGENQFCTSVSTPVHLKSTKSVHLLDLLIPSLPSRDPLSQKLKSWKDQILSF